MRILLLLIACLGVDVSLYARGPATDTARFNALMRKARPFYQTDIDSVGFYFRQARALAIANHDRLEYADAGTQLGNYFRNTGDFTTAMPYYTEAKAIYDSLNDWLGEGNVTNDIAQLYKAIAATRNTGELIDQAIEQAIQSYGFYLRGHDTERMANALNTQGIIYRDKAKLKGFRSYYDTAYARYLQALGLIEQSGKGKDMIEMLYNNIAQIFLEYKKDPRTAISYLQRSVALNLVSNYKRSLNHDYNNLSHAYMDLGMIDSSIYYGRKTLENAIELNLPDRRYDAYNQLYFCFEAGKRYDSALHYFKIATELNDSMTNLAKVKEVLTLQAKYKSAKDEIAITKLNAENSAKNKAIGFLVVVLTLLGVVVAGFSYLVVRLRAQKRQIAEQRVRLEVMLRELHHRVKNNLQIVSSLLGLQRYRSEDAETVAVLQESQHRVQAMSLIHQRLYNNDALNTVNIREYLIDLCESLLSSYGYDRDSFDLEVSICTDVMDIDHALPIGLIVNELVTNAFKYAFPPGAGRPALHISLEQDSRSMVLVVRDNGVGIDESRWRQGKESFGKQLIGALCKQLRATQEMGVREGTAITITIPREVAA